MDFAHLVKQVYSCFAFYLFVFFLPGCQDLKEFTIVRSQLITECKEKQIYLVTNAPLRTLWTLK